MDNLVFEESINTEVSTSEFVDKQWLYVNDNNNGSYSSQIVLDTTPLSNAGGYIGWMESFIAMPLVLQVEADGAVLTEALAADFLVGMKSGFWQVIHSLTCEFNNGNIIQQVPFLNVFTSFKNLTSWSQEDIKNWGQVCGFYPDTARSWLYNASATGDANPCLNNLLANGTGLCNNRNAPIVSMSVFVASTFTGTPVTPVPDPYTPAGTIANATGAYNLSTQATRVADDLRSQYNMGFYQRQLWLVFSLTTQTYALNNPSANQASLLSSGTTPAVSNGFNQTFQSYVRASAGSRALVFQAIIRLKDIADFFSKCPILKGATMRLYINTNQCYLPLAVRNPARSAATGAITSSSALALTSAPVILGGGATCPIMIASNDIGQGLSVLDPLAAAVAAEVAVRASLSIVRTQFSQMTNQISAPLTAVRLYAPCYTFNPIAEQRYLSLVPSKKILYNDIFQYYFSGIGSGDTFNILVTNGIPNVRGVLVVPVLPKASNGVATNGGILAAETTTNTLLSPFASTGGSPDPISLGNFNIQVSGKNLFISNLQYTFENFVEQIVSSNQLNGSLTTSLGSGLIGFEDWTNLYRYYYGNVSRSLPSEEGVSKAIQITGQNLSSVACDLMVFVEFEREITIDVRTGARVM